MSRGLRRNGGSSGGKRAHLEGELAGGNYVEPAILADNNKMRVFQEKIFGPIVSVTKFKDETDALATANDTLYGLGAGVWSRDGNTAYRMGRAIQAAYGPIATARAPGFWRLQGLRHRSRDP